jgi:tRNA(Ile)-lysidine synthase
MDLLQAFKEFTAKQQLFSPGDHLLLAVSGGLDSMVLCELCHRAGLDFTIVHCNFQLRGAESERDEQFVRQLSTKYARKVIVERFDTEQYAAQKKLSIQEAAREQRYSWFRLLADPSATNRSATSPSATNSSATDPSATDLSTTDRPPTNRPVKHLIVTAHHLDDNIETMLMNFFKGTGITGLRAMLPSHEGIIRPLLFATRAGLQQFAGDNRLTWVEDSSNQSDKYTRNFFRHQVIPLVQQAYPAVQGNLSDNLGRFREIELIYRRAIEQQKKKLLEYKGNEIHIPVLKLKKAEPILTLLYEIITPYGFSPQQTGAVAALLDSESGKYVRSGTYRILKNRHWLIISPLDTIEAATILVEAANTTIAYEQGMLRLEQLPLSRLPEGVLPAIPAAASSSPATGLPATPPPPITAAHPPARAPRKRPNPGGPPANPIAWLDAEQINFPLLLRKWQPGDYFYPLGMRKKKKLARFFIDNKLSLADKEKIWVVEMDKKIVWVVGLRIDDRFRITPSTRQVLKIETGLA